MIAIPIWLFVLFIVISIPGDILILLSLFWIGMKIRFRFEGNDRIKETESASKCPYFIETPELEEDINQKEKSAYDK